MVAVDLLQPCFTKGSDCSKKCKCFSKHAWTQCVLIGVLKGAVALRSKILIKQGHLCSYSILRGLWLDVVAPYSAWRRPATSTPRPMHDEET